VSGSAVATLAAASLPTLDAWGDLAQARAALAGAPSRIRLQQMPTAIRMATPRNSRQTIVLEMTAGNTIQIDP